MVTLRFKLGDDHDRQDDVMFVKPRESGRVGEQDARVEDVGTTVHRVGHANSPGRPALGAGAADRTRRFPGTPGTDVSNGPGLPSKEGRTGPRVARADVRRASRGGGLEDRRQHSRYPCFWPGESTQSCLACPIHSPFTGHAAGVQGGVPSGDRAQAMTHTCGYVPNRTVVPAKSPLCGKLASKRHRNRTQSGWTATAGTRRAAALRSS
jgi:hypothetical protein